MIPDPVVFLGAVTSSHFRQHHSDGGPVVLDGLYLKAFPGFFSMLPFLEIASAGAWMSAGPCCDEYTIAEGPVQRLD